MFWIVVFASVTVVGMATAVVYEDFADVQCNPFAVRDDGTRAVDVSSDVFAIGVVVILILFANLLWRFEKSLRIDLLPSPEQVQEKRKQADRTDLVTILLVGFGTLTIMPASPLWQLVEQWVMHHP
ncbi:MAG: hypothetical protein CEO22_641 [Candidatus Berkelbacteria bacterium Gr01-1014_85]|uniref:Uncharacterized protein n=1 Tax=Candidatus Berkelbacteria bacterium Gr01-1014_85 TaxID=2017150 RepID=A0A554J9D3_9BACT|nr:MAG: hypothetical protein CEO22_641 [Candidatus Berkelbacteria bacterium Gr01-1014_85]